uniref:Uncharacterized protein n=1 Tax=Ascaris lumbricoides TaxID=6252 RepID=A0A0M3HP07_ASCLU
MHSFLLFILDYIKSVYRLYYNLFELSVSFLSSRPKHSILCGFAIAESFNHSVFVIGDAVKLNILKSNKYHINALLLYNITADVVLHFIERLERED